MRLAAESGNAAEDERADSRSRRLQQRAAADEDFIYFISAGVDPEKRGSGAFRRLFTPFLEYADEHGLACYLDCYTCLLYTSRCV